MNKKLLLNLFISVVALFGFMIESYSQSLSSLGSYVWRATDEPKTFNSKLQLSFVQKAHGFPEFGTVLAGGGYRAHEDGGVFQLYFPYSNTYGGNVPKFRLGKYSNQGWTD